jgi:large subunit ribosomal protein L10
MPTEAKRATVAELREDLAKSRTLIVSEYRGLTVKEIAEIRRALRKQDVTYRVVKNRLMRIAAEDSVGEALSPLLIGPTAIAFGTDEAGTAKAVLDATRPYNKIVRITGAVLGDKAIDADAVTRLCATWAMPSRRSPRRRPRPKAPDDHPHRTHRLTPRRSIKERLPWQLPFPRTTCSQPSTR